MSLIQDPQEAIEKLANQEYVVVQISDYISDKELDSAISTTAAVIEEMSPLALQTLNIVLFPWDKHSSIGFTKKGSEPDEDNKWYYHHHHHMSQEVFSSFVNVENPTLKEFWEAQKQLLKATENIFLEIAHAFDPYIPGFENAVCYREGIPWITNRTLIYEPNKNDQNLYADAHGDVSALTLALKNTHPGLQGKVRGQSFEYFDPGDGKAILFAGRRAKLATNNRVSDAFET